LVRIQGRLVLVRFPVWILVLNARASIPRAWIPRVSIPRVSTGTRQAGVPKGVPWLEQSLPDGRTPGRLVSARLFDQQVGHSAGPSAERNEAFLRSETAAWRRIGPTALAAPLRVFLAAHRSAFPAGLRCAPGHRFFAVDALLLPRLARTLEAGNCGAKDRRAVRAFPPAVASSTPC
jgi:hypothetical protein